MTRPGKSGKFTALQFKPPITYILGRKFIVPCHPYAMCHNMFLLNIVDPIFAHSYIQLNSSGRFCSYGLCSGNLLCYKVVLVRLIC